MGRGRWVRGEEVKKSEEEGDRNGQGNNMYDIVRIEWHR
jgi:hypothetical protein